MNPVLLLALGWVPLWILLVHRGPLRPGHLLVAGAFVGLVGAICFVELRRYGHLPATGGAVVPFLEIRLEDALRFACLGVSGALAAGRTLERWGRRPGERSADPTPESRAD
jgi:hypothetical protein